MDSQWLADDVLAGFGSAGVAFGTQRWREFIFFIRLMKAFKASDGGTRNQLLSDGWKLVEWLKEIPEAETRQFRHMLIYMLFPDQFERIFGGTDRKAIIRAFMQKSRPEAKQMSAAEIDHALYDIRQEQEAKQGSADIDLYLSVA